MKLELTPDEVEVLRRLLRGYLGELSYEIADTNTSRFRSELRAHRQVVQDILDRLPADAAAVER